MIIARSISDVPYSKKSVVTVGTFDGVHLGHQKIILELCSRAKSRNARSVLITFDPHPREVVGRGPVKLLTTLKERIENLNTTEIDILLILHFTFEFSRQSSREFYEGQVGNGIGVEEVVIGYDHMFGRDREAGADELRRIGEELGFTVHLEPPFQVGGEAVGSSRIREYLLRGDVEKAARMLGRPYTLQGVVAKGVGRGAALGFPTANLGSIDKVKLIPAEGVYCVEVEVRDQKLVGMLNIGYRPTFKDDRGLTVEVHILDFDADLYGEEVRTSFLRRLRGEKKFKSPEELAAQLRRDEQECRALIREMNNYAIQAS